jgi:hypothetical protein
MVIFFAIVGLCAFGFVRWYQKEKWKSVAAFSDAMRNLNEQHGTAFPTSGFATELILSDGSYGQNSLIFDSKTKKVCIAVGRRGQFFCKVVDRSFFRSWSTGVEWVGLKKERSRFYIDFFVNDLSSPRLRIGCRNLQHMEEWSARLGLLLR